MWFILLITHLLMSFNLKYFKQSFQIANVLGLHTSCFWLVYSLGFGLVTFSENKKTLRKQEAREPQNLWNVTFLCGSLLNHSSIPSA